MTSMERRVRIDAPSERVWAVLIDVERWPAWTASVKKLERIDDGRLALGSRARLWLKGALGGSNWTVTSFGGAARLRGKVALFRGSSASVTTN